jgi:transposase
MSINLTGVEETQLKRLHKQIKDRKTCDMIKCILLLNKGFSASEISEILLIDDDTVRNWQKQFEDQKFFSAWLQNNYKHYSGKLTSDELKMVETFLKDNIISDSKQIIQFVKAEFGITYSASGLVSLLHRLGYEYKNTILIPSNYSPEKQKAFKEMYDELSKNLKSEDAILFGDGVHPQHNTTCSKAWIKKGETQEIKSNTGRSRINIHGAYNPATQEIVIHEDETLNTENTKKFFKKIEDYYNGKAKIYLILDNARYYKNKEIDEYLKTSRIEILYLPAYSPNLNLIERLWKFMRKKVMNNKFYEKFALFKKTLLEFFENSEKYRDELASFIGQRLHLFKN